MIKHAEDMVHEIKERMRGGEGQVTITHLLQPGEFKGKARLCARLTLGPGCSIGYHEHADEEEIFYIISGEAALTDGSSEQALRPGDASVTLGGQGHALRNAGAGPLEVLALILLYQ